MAEPAPGDRWEVGSEFAGPDGLLGPERGGVVPAGAQLYAAGAGALVRLLEDLRIAVLHVPSYFCIDVVEVLRHHLEIRWYRELPDAGGPRFATLDARPGEAVLAVDLFGRGDAEPWLDWTTAHPRVVLIEDHTHDPWSTWARTSRAPWCVASWRKTLPLADGAVLWSPRGLPVPTPDAGESAGARLKLEAMTLKAHWLAGGPGTKAEFRRRQVAGEDAITGSTVAALPITREVIHRLDLAGLRARRRTNARVLASRLAVLPDCERLWAPPAVGTDDKVSFGVQLKCVSEAARDELRRGLVARRIYPAVHWEQDPDGLWSGDEEALDLGRRILTLPTDHRLGIGDVLRVLDAVAELGTVLRSVV